MKKTISVLLVLALAFSLGCAAFADGTAADGIYSVKAVITDVDDQNVIAPIFAQSADVTVAGGSAVLFVYIADPVPCSGSASGEIVSVSDPILTVDGTSCAGYISTQNTTRTFHAYDGRFTIADGAELTCDTVTFTLPASVIAAGGTTSFVMTVCAEPLTDEAGVRIDISGIPAAAQETTAPEEAEMPAEEAPAEDAEEPVQDGAEEPEDVPAAAPSYTVTVPASVTMGSLSASENTTLNYTVGVEASDLGEGYIDITAPVLGTLTGENGTIVFSNALTGNTGISESAGASGTLTVTASNAAAAAPGSYAGTLNFTVSYYAG